MTWLQLTQMLLVSAFSAGGAWAGVRMQLRYMERDIERAHKRLDSHDENFTQLYRSGL